MKQIPSFLFYFILFTKKKPLFLFYFILFTKIHATSNKKKLPDRQRRWARAPQADQPNDETKQNVENKLN